ncbi:Mbeg1-like protein, partial [Eubacterium ventriosum]|uniref:Mbeg1-like protein n=1 Tax=Eubacterium ventriosum TaxID=39496 RepID=UPI003AB3122F
DEYAEVSDKIKTIIPESSVVGILLEHEEKFIIVKSTQKGLLQHDAFSWELIGTQFLAAEERTQYSEISDAALKTWLSQMDTEERTLFVDTLFDILQSTDAKTLMDLNANKLETAMSLMKTIKNLDDDKKAGMNKILGELFKDNVMAAVNTVFKTKEKQEKKKKNGKYIVLKRKKQAD